MEVVKIGNYKASKYERAVEYNLYKLCSKVGISGIKVVKSGYKQDYWDYTSYGIVYSMYVDIKYLDLVNKYLRAFICDFKGSDVIIGKGNILVTFSILWDIGSLDNRNLSNFISYCDGM